MIRLTTILTFITVTSFSQQNLTINGSGATVTINAPGASSNVYVNYQPPEQNSVLTINKASTPSNMYINYRSQLSNCDVITDNQTTGWDDYSDGTNTTVIYNGALHLLDNVSTLEHQTKVRTTMFEQADVMTIKIDLTFVQLNNSANMDGISGSPDDGYGETNSTGDDNINRSGFSFAVVHPLFMVRPIFSIVKAVDYATSNNIEIWGIYPAATPGYTSFERIYSGTAIPINERFTLEIDYRYLTDIYSTNIRVDGVNLVAGFESGMVSNYGFNNSFLFQCKGIATEPAEYYIHRFEIISRHE